MLEKKIRMVYGVGEQTEKLYQRLGIYTIEDLLRFYPRNYEDWSTVVTMEDARLGTMSVVEGTVFKRPEVYRVKSGITVYKAMITDGESDMKLTFFNNKYITSSLKEGVKYTFRGKISGTLFSKEMICPEFILSTRKSSFLPIYPQTRGLTSRMISASVKQVLCKYEKEIKEVLPKRVLEKYKLCPLDFALKNIHFPESEESLSKAKRRLVFEEFLFLQLGLLSIRDGGKIENRHRIVKIYPQEYVKLFPFTLTRAQQNAISDIVNDMADETPMNRLLQGDVGSGKTAVAAAACFCVIRSGLQVAMMVPTEILAGQHYKSLSVLLEPAGISTALLTGSVKGRERKEILRRLRMGEINFIIGTHTLFTDKVEFSELGLVITDEQHRFGVNQRLALAQKGDRTHHLVMSATPIPRTLALMIYGDLQISILDELPEGRQRVDTYLITSKIRTRAYRYIQKHIDEGRQGYLICPLIDEDESGMASVNEYAQIVSEAFPNIASQVLHGKMKPAEKESVMHSFSAGDTKLLISTTVVEVGVDVPNAAIMLIENAERYGLSQLHQLRGRIGRGKHKSTCILLSDSQNEETLARLKLFCGTSDGFKIAEADLEMRGPGDFFGQKQHGLPEMKIANMMKDMDILIEAQALAAEISQAGECGEFKPIYHQSRRLFEKSGADFVVI